MKPLLKTLALAGTVAFLPVAAMAETAISLPGTGFAPEGITADSDGNLYVGSLTQGRIVKIDPDSNVITEFAGAGANGMVSVIGLHAVGETVYACSSDPGASTLTGTAPTALVAFNRTTGSTAGRYELPDGGGFCNDLAELPDGTILATDSFAPRIYALKPGAKQLEIWLDDAQFAGEGFNLNGIAYDDGAVYVLRYNTGTLHRISVEDDGSAGAVTNVVLTAAITSPDGLTGLGGGRFLIVEGGGLTAGVRGALLGITLHDGKAVVETISPDLNVPTTAAVIGDTAYVVEGQLDHLFDPKAGPADPYQILTIKLPDAYR